MWSRRSEALFAASLVARLACAAGYGGARPGAVGADAPHECSDPYEVPAVAVAGADIEVPGDARRCAQECQGRCRDEFRIARIAEVCSETSASMARKISPSFPRLCEPTRAATRPAHKRGGRIDNSRSGRSSTRRRRLIAQPGSSRLAEIAKPSAQRIATRVTISKADEPCVPRG